MRKNICLTVLFICLFMFACDAHSSRYQPITALRLPSQSGQKEEALRHIKLQIEGIKKKLSDRKDALDDFEDVLSSYRGTRLENLDNDVAQELLGLSDEVGDLNMELSDLLGKDNIKSFNDILELLHNNVASLFNNSGAGMTSAYEAVNDAYINATHELEEMMGVLDAKLEEVETAIQESSRKPIEPDNVSAPAGNRGNL